MIERDGESMTNADVLAYVTSLTNDEVSGLLDQIELCLLNGSIVAKDIREVRFQGGIKCPCCGGKGVRNGISNGKQRYLCKNPDCSKKTFGDYTNSVISGTHLPLQIWRKYAECVILELNIQ